MTDTEVIEALRTLGGSGVIAVLGAIGRLDTNRLTGPQAIALVGAADLFIATVEAQLHGDVPVQQIIASYNRIVPAQFGLDL